MTNSSGGHEVAGRERPISKAARAGGLRLSVDPAHRVAFEDSLAGIVAAKAAGMRCVGMATTCAGTEPTEADLVVADLTGAERPPRTDQ